MAIKTFTMSYETEDEALDDIKNMQQGQPGYSETYVEGGPTYSQTTSGGWAWFVKYKTYYG